jgi:cytochrome b
MKPDAVRIWDLPTRLFHWALLAAVAGLFATAYGPDTWILWHPRLGYAVLALLLFRLAWGVVGGRWSRFASFIQGPRAVLAYLRHAPGAPASPGHNPLGALAVVTLLAVLLAQVGTGLVSDDEIGFTGPLNHLVSSALGLAATGWHKGWGQWLIVGLVALHVAAIAFYRVVRRERLVGPMLHGDKPLPAGTPASRDDALNRLLALVIFAACAGLVWWLVQPAPLA